ncbi:hypothetical protein [Xenorhabdus bharatensis]|uniref:hypothetical protein n=1 Tax=Xenorhabdus bharatensis TaxID=3136256 RepID=UPI0030F3B60C
MLRKFAVVLFLVPSIANAMWFTQSDENIFNEKKAFMIGQLFNSSSAIAFDCEDGELSISYLEDDKITEDEISGTPMNLIFKVDSNPIVKFNAVMERRNKDTMAVTSSEKSEIIKILSQLRNAKSNFMFGITNPNIDMKHSGKGDIKNSTKAVNKFISDCGIKVD